LVNNAGTPGRIGPLWEADPEEWRRCVEVNLYGTFLCIRAVLPGMVARKRGRIINVASGAAASASGYMLAYGSAKAGIVRLTTGLAAETRAHGIQVFAINPGAVLTEMVQYGRDSAEGRRYTPVFHTLPEQYWAPPERPAALCVLLASGQADALSG